MKVFKTWPLMVMWWNKSKIRVERKSSHRHTSLPSVKEVPAYEQLGETAAIRSETLWGATWPQKLP
jgi:hypothetical protein